MLSRTFPTFAAALLALSITAAHAEDSTVASTYVTYGDLDLSQPADAKILADRLQDAAKSVCLKANPDIGFEMHKCIMTAADTAMLQIEDRLDQSVHSNLSNVRISMESP